MRNKAHHGFISVEIGEHRLLVVCQKHPRKSVLKLELASSVLLLALYVCSFLILLGLKQFLSSSKLLYHCHRAIRSNSSSMTKHQSGKASCSSWLINKLLVSSLGNSTTLQASFDLYRRKKTYLYGRKHIFPWNIYQASSIHASSSFHPIKTGDLDFGTMLDQRNPDRDGDASSTASPSGLSNTSLQT